MGWPKLNVLAYYYYEDVMNLSHGAIARLQWSLLKNMKEIQLWLLSILVRWFSIQMLRYSENISELRWNFYSWNATFFIWGQTQSLHVSYEVMVDTIYMCCSGMCHQHKFATQSGHASPKYAEQVCTALCECISKCWQVHKLNMHIPCLSRATKALHSDPQL